MTLEKAAVISTVLVNVALVIALCAIALDFVTSLFRRQRHTGLLRDLLGDAPEPTVKHTPKRNSDDAILEREQERARERSKKAIGEIVDAY